MTRTICTSMLLLATSLSAGLFLDGEDAERQEPGGPPSVYFSQTTRYHTDSFEAGSGAVSRIELGQVTKGSYAVTVRVSQIGDSHYSFLSDGESLIEAAELLDEIGWSIRLLLRDGEEVLVDRVVFIETPRALAAEGAAGNLAGDRWLAISAHPFLGVYLEARELRLEGAFDNLVLEVESQANRAAHESVRICVELVDFTTQMDELQ